MHQPVVCRNCGTLAIHEPFLGGDVTRCEVCQGWCCPAELDRASAEELYGEEYFNGGEYSSYEAAGSSHHRNFTRKLKIMRAHGLPPPGEVRMLEIGSATGEFLRIARDAGIENGLGLEASAYARRIATERGLRVLSPFDAAANDAIQRLCPNTIVGWDVWEHLPDPAAVWDALLRSAAPSAIVALTTVDASSLVARLRGRRWRQFHPPTHLNYPTRLSLRMFLEKRGFRVLRQRSFGYFRPLREYARALGARCGPAAIWNTPVFLDVLDTQFVIAQRGQ